MPVSSLTRVYKYNKRYCFCDIIGDARRPRNPFPKHASERTSAGAPPRSGFDPTNSPHRGLADRRIDRSIRNGRRRGRTFDDSPRAPRSSAASSHDSPAAEPPERQRVAARRRTAGRARRTPDTNGRISGYPNTIGRSITHPDRPSAEKTSKAAASKCSQSRKTSARTKMRREDEVMQIACGRPLSGSDNPTATPRPAVLSISISEGRGGLLGIRPSPHPLLGADSPDAPREIADIRNRFDAKLQIISDFHYFCRR